LAQNWQMETILAFVLIIISLINRKHKCCFWSRVKYRFLKHQKSATAVLRIFNTLTDWGFYFQLKMSRIKTSSCVQADKHLVLTRCHDETSLLINWSMGVQKDSSCRLHQFYYFI
jgi:hypothetical protein